MKKDEILKILDIASFIMIIAATVLVVIFEFAGGYGFMKCSIIMYFLGLLLLSVLLGIRVYFAFAKKQINEDESNTENADETSKTNSAELSKKQKIGLIAMLAASIAILIFTLVVMILY